MTLTSQYLHKFWGHFLIQSFWSHAHAHTHTWQEATLQLFIWHDRSDSATTDRHDMWFHRFITSHLCIDLNGSSILGFLFYTLCWSSLGLYVITVSYTNTEGLICMYANKMTRSFKANTGPATTPWLADEEETPKSPWTVRRQRQTPISSQAKVHTHACSSINMEAHGRGEDWWQADAVGASGKAR